MKKTPITFWWRRARATDHPIWHFMKGCPSFPFAVKNGKHAESIRTVINPRSGSKCDHCQRLRKVAP